MASTLEKAEEEGAARALNRWKAVRPKAGALQTHIKTAEQIRKQKELNLADEGHSAAEPGMSV